MSAAAAAACGISLLGSDDCEVVQRVLCVLDGEPCLVHPSPSACVARECAAALERVLVRDPDNLPAVFVLRTLAQISPSFCKPRAIYFARPRMQKFCARVLRTGHPSVAAGTALAERLANRAEVELHKHSLHFVAVWAEWVQQDSATAVRLLRVLSDAGFLPAMHNLGVAYFKGTGVAQDRAAALELFQRAAGDVDAGGGLHVGALFCVAVSLSRFEHHNKRGKALYQAAADAGHPAAMYNLARAYRCGDGVEEDHVRAVALFKLCAETGDPDAMISLGFCYEAGIGSERDAARAAAMYKRAADECSDSNALRCLGVCYANGNGVPKDENRAATLFRRASDAGDARAAAMLATCLENGAGVAVDKHAAAALYWHGVEGGDPCAMFNAACRLVVGQQPWPRDVRLAAALLKRAADCGSREARMAVDHILEFPP
eukprot:TRINITY_DN1498_c0_g1_i4.p1 TRINITY_DN1498_c0_g1~~TRINITY_DN1498_c0_g1_i4.p1  ORF type:complete len:432 (+),score=106.48 TRINITY_DN1498_c0_g1_i4:109-1404(+)